MPDTDAPAPRALVQIMGQYYWLEIAAWYREINWPYVCAHDIVRDSDTCWCGRYARVRTEMI
jgi:hypothetical protein